MRVKNLLSAIFNNEPDVYPMIGLPSSKPIGYKVIGNVSQEALVAQIIKEIANQNSTPHKEFCSRFKTISDKFFVSTGKLYSETAELHGYKALKQQPIGNFFMPVTTRSSSAGEKNQTNKEKVKASNKKKRSRSVHHRNDAK